MAVPAATRVAGGVSSSYQLHAPWPIHITRGEGWHLPDVDGTHHLDFHNGFGSMVQGHAHPAIRDVVAKRHAEGAHFGACVRSPRGPEPPADRRHRRGDR
jgi:glutamate-1-semialdehyde 2,1-aminomutase